MNAAKASSEIPIATIAAASMGHACTCDDGGITCDRAGDSGAAPRGTIGSR